MSDDDTINSVSDKIMCIEFINPTYRMFFPNGQVDPKDMEYINRNDHYDKLGFSYETLEVTITKNGEQTAEPIITEFNGNLSKKVQNEFPPSIKKVKESFKKEIKESPKKNASKDQARVLKERWCKEIIDCFAALYGFDVAKPCSYLSMQMRIKFRELIRIDKGALPRLIVYIINKFAERLKASIHSRINATSSKDNTTVIEKADSSEVLHEQIDKMLSSSSSYFTKFNMDCYEVDSSATINKVISALSDAYEEMHRVLILVKPLYNILRSHLRLAMTPITIEEIHWRVFYESVYTEGNLKTLLYLYSSDIPKRDVKYSSMLQNISTFLHNIKVVWNEKVMQMNCMQRQNLIDTMLFNDEFVKFSWEDNVYINLNKPIVELKDEFMPLINEELKVEGKKKKKSRRRKKKAKQVPIENTIKEKTEEEIKYSDIVELPNEINATSDIECEDAPVTKPLKVPNIPPEQLSALKAKFLAKLKSAVNKM
jgi:hypothetical protein